MNLGFLKRNIPLAKNVDTRRMCSVMVINYSLILQKNKLCVITKEEVVLLVIQHTYYIMQRTNNIKNP